MVICQSNADCCRRLASRSLEPKGPYPPRPTPQHWPLNAHHIVFLHLCYGICSMPDNLSKLRISFSMVYIKLKICVMKFFTKLLIGEK